MPATRSKRKCAARPPVEPTQPVKKQRTPRKAEKVPEMPVEAPRPAEKMTTRTATGRLPPKRPDSPEPIVRPPARKRPKPALQAYFLVFAQNMQLLLAMIGEQGSYMRDIAERHRLAHLAIESDDTVAAKHGSELSGRFLYVMMGIESCIKRAVQDLAKVVETYTNHTLSSELDPRCVLQDVSPDMDCCPALFKAFDALPLDFVSKGAPPLVRAGPSTPRKRKKRPTEAPSGSSVKPITLLDVSNAYKFVLPHPSVARMLQKDGGATVDELVSFAGLSHLEIHNNEPSVLLIGSVNAIRHASELLCTLIRTQTCFMAATFDFSHIERLDPFYAKPDGPADSSSDSGRSSMVAGPSSATSVLVSSPKMS